MDEPKSDVPTRTGLRSLPVNVWVVTATSFLTDVSSEMIFNLVPLFLANVLKAGTAVIGLIDGLAETTASLLKIYSGALSDKLGTRKWITVAGYALSTVSKPFLFIANAWGWVLGVRVSDRVRHRQVFIPFHFREAAANLLTNPALDPYAKIPEFKVCAVRVERA